MSCAQRTLRAPVQTSPLQFGSFVAMSSRTLLSTSTPRHAPRCVSQSWLWPVSIVSLSRAGLARVQRHDLVRVHADVRSAAQSLER